MRRVLSYFFRGLILLLPLGVTAWVLGGAFWTIDEWVRTQFPRVDDWAREQFSIPLIGVGFAATVTAITAVGFFASHFFTRRIISSFEKLIARVPLVKLLHGSLKDLLKAFVGDQRKFDRPVLVSLKNLGDVRAIGFVTRDDMGPFGAEGCVAVYFPQSYNFAGQTLVVPRSAITPINRSSAEVMTLVVSGGVSAAGSDLQGHPVEKNERRSGRDRRNGANLSGAL